MRLFVSIPIPAAVQDSLRQAQHELREALSPRAKEAVRWTRPEQIHLTLRFLGEVPEDRLAELSAALRNAAQGSPCLELRAENTGFFPEPRHPRVLWAGVTEARNALIPLQRRIEAAARNFTPAPEEKPFTGHLTLGRIQRLAPREVEPLRRVAEAMAARRFGHWTAASFHLMRSELLPQGARHSSLAEFPLETDSAL